MQRILLAEDDRRLAQLVQEYLGHHGFLVSAEHSGLTVSRNVKTLNPDLVILDIMLPGKDGLSLCREIREFYSGPILLLTARNTDSDQVLGLDYGADDYVIKPAEPRVLLARIRALLRRTQKSLEEHDNHLVFGKLTVHHRAREVQLNEHQVELSSHEFDLLFALARHAGQILSREYLFTTVHGRSYDGLDRSIDVRISQLRKKLGDDSTKPQKIKTVWGKGYLFVADAWE